MIVYEHNGFYGQYTEAGWLVSAWRRPSGVKDPAYVESLPGFESAKITYGAAGIRTNNDKDEFDGWPPNYTPPPTASGRKISKEDLL